ncbi:MAG: hypothetical protein ABW022_20285, partial [Actinoplanes sp.]
MSTDAELPVLDALSARLRRSGDSLDAAGGGAPGVPDAGDVAAMMGAVVAHLSAGAGEMVVGLKEAGDQVAQARQAY